MGRAASVPSLVVHLTLRLGKTNLCFSDDDKSICQLVFVSCEEFFQHINFGRGTFVLKAKEHKTSVGLLFTKDHFAEILVVCY